MERFCNETFLDPESMTKAELLVAVGSFEITNVFNRKRLTY